MIEPNLKWGEGEGKGAHFLPRQGSSSRSGSERRFVPWIAMWILGLAAGVYPLIGQVPDLAGKTFTKPVSRYYWRLLKVPGVRVADTGRVEFRTRLSFDTATFSSGASFFQNDFDSEVSFRAATFESTSFFG